MLSPEQARDLVEHFGGIRPAARAVGIPFSSLWKSLNPERKREQNRLTFARWSAKHPGRHAENCRRLRERRANQGLCTRCGREPPTTGAVCWTCLNEMEEQRALSL